MNLTRNNSGFNRAQVVGWPPVRSFRKNIIAVQKTNIQESDKVNAGSAGALVKISMDGAPYLRKVDLKMYKNYRELSDALGNMFHSFTAGKWYCYTNFNILVPYITPLILVTI